MPSYRVCFLNEIPRNDRLFRCCQRSIVIRSARTRERAIEAAKKRFARLEGIHDWTIHASLIEIEPITLEPTSESRTTTPSARMHGHEKDVRDHARSRLGGLAVERDDEGSLPSNAGSPRDRHTGH
jgi:hypothetical protein